MPSTSTSNYIFFFRLLLIIVTFISLHLLLTSMYQKQAINSWQFPMLLAILIEEFMF